MTEKAPPLPALSPTVAKVLLTVSAVLGTLGGFALLSSSERAAAPPAEPAPQRAPLPELLPIDVGPAPQTTAAPRQVKARPPRPIRFTRSSR